MMNRNVNKPNYSGSLADYKQSRGYEIPIPVQPGKPSGKSPKEQIKRKKPMSSSKQKQGFAYLDA